MSAGPGDGSDRGGPTVGSAEGGAPPSTPYPPAQGIAHVWPREPVMIGMVHLLPLPGAPRHAGSMEAVLTRARADAAALAEAGFDGVIVENFMDSPFHPGPVPPVTVAAMTSAVGAVREVTDLPVGVNVLRNDGEAALAIAAVTGAAFVRINVHTGSMWTDQGLVEGRAHETLRLRSALGVPAAILADVQVKHATPVPGAGLTDTAADTWFRGLADALIVSGTGTGHATRPGDVAEVTRAAPGAPVLVGSGVTAATIAALLPGIAGAIVGSTLMREGRAGAGVDPGRARAFMDSVRGAATGRG